MKTNPKYTKKERRARAVGFAVAALYFNGGDQLTRNFMWDILRELAPDAYDLISKDEAAAYRKYADGVV